jgi:hypothetical protein
VKVLKGLNINIPFTDALNEMPAYTKFLKDILAKKRSIPELVNDCNVLSLSNQCSALINNKLPEKLSDPGRFVITIGLGNYRYKALCDLGASTSLLPLSIWKDINMGDLQPVKMKLYMADGSCVQPTGIMEDVPVQVGKFFIPNDFVVMDIDADVLVPIILGRPFLATAGARIDVQKGVLNLTIGDEEVEFHFNKTMNGPEVDEMIETVLQAVDEGAAAPKKEEPPHGKHKEELEEKWRAELKEELRLELRDVLKAELRQEMRETELKRTAMKKVEQPFPRNKKEEAFAPGFLPRSDEPKVYTMGKADSVFWEYLFGDDPRKDEKERWRALQARMNDPGGTEPENDARTTSVKHPGVETGVSRSNVDPG